MLEPQLCKIERADEDVDRADRVVQPDIVLDPGRKQVGLLAAIAALERANRHKPNRTLKAPKCPSFLPSLVAQLSERVTEPLPHVERHGVALLGIVEGDNADALSDALQ